MADKPLAHDRDLEGLRRAYGIKAADWSDQARLAGQLRAAVIVDDTSKVVAPPQKRIFGWRCDQVLVAGNYSGFEITILAPRGAYLWATSADGTNRMQTESLPAFNVGGAVTHILQSYDNMTPFSTVNRGWSLGPPAGLNQANFRFVTPWLPLYFEHGRVIHIYNASLGTAATCDLVLQEIP